MSNENPTDEEQRRRPDEVISPVGEVKPLEQSRYSALDHTDLVHLLDEVDDERARARFREAIYIAIIVWLCFFALLRFAPQYFRPNLIAIHRPENEKQTTMIELPPEQVKKLIKPRKTPNIAERDQAAQSPKPSPEQAMPKQGQIAPQQQPTQQPVQQQPQQQQPQQPKPTPPAKTQTQQPPLVDSPQPNTSSSKPDFSMNNKSAGEQIKQAARGGRTGGMTGGDGGSGPTRNGGQTGTTILSDTQGVDFSKYLARLLRDIKRNWDPLIPEECKPPLMKQGITGIRFTINRDGSITAMNLDYSTHDDAINRSAWGSIKSMGLAQPLPAEFKGPTLELRIEFRVNKDGQDAR